jgi:hypothetical protein
VLLLSAVVLCCKACTYISVFVLNFVFTASHKVVYVQRWAAASTTIGTADTDAGALLVVSLSLLLTLFAMYTVMYIRF